MCIYNGGVYCFASCFVSWDVGTDSVGVADIFVFDAVFFLFSSSFSLLMWAQCFFVIARAVCKQSKFVLIFKLWFVYVCVCACENICVCRWRSCISSIDRPLFFDTCTCLSIFVWCVRQYSFKSRKRARAAENKTKFFCLFPLNCIVVFVSLTLFNRFFFLWLFL